MSDKKKKETALEKPSLLESDLYETVENFFADEKNCKKTGSEVSSPISLRIFGGTIRPDVFGVTEPTAKDFRIYMGEGKLSFRGRDFDICKGQAITLQRFADHVYIFFPRASWSELDEAEQSGILSECKNLKLGLIIIDKDSCEEKVEAHTNHDLVEEEKRVDAKNRMVQYFPDFAKTQENADFFKKHLKFADNIVKESHILIDYLGNSFRKFTPRKKTSIELWSDEDDSFEFYRFYESPRGIVYLISKPFGCDIFDTDSPALVIQERFERSIIKKQVNRQKLSQYIDERLKRKGRVAAGDYLFYGTDTAEKVLNHFEDVKAEHFSVYEQIEILGVEKEQIKLNVENSLQRIMSFLNSLK